MMDTYQNYEIQEIPLSSSLFHNRVEVFLASNGLRMERLDMYLAIQDTGGDFLAGAGLSGDIIKCVAVSSRARSEGLVAPLVSRLIAKASERGVHNLKVFTKPEYQAVFESLGFRVLARAPLAILMENGGGLEQYCAYLRSLRRPGPCGVIVMNANPFTLGHRYLVEKALEQVRNLFVIPVREENEFFPYQERLEMIQAGVAAFGDRVTVAEGSAYCISAATFPTYFLKELSEAAETQMRLDIDLFRTHISPALDAPVRFVGSEPTDQLTARYNILLQELMPGKVVEIPRLEQVSASRVRSSAFLEAAALTPVTTHPYVLAALAADALRKELTTPWKPGLVCDHFQGAHRDMNYSMMLKSIRAIRPFFPRMARAESAEELRLAGLDAEQAMLEATGGVNAHRGSIYAFGLTLAAAGLASRRGMEAADYEDFIQSSLSQMAQALLDNRLTDSEMHSTHGRRAVDSYHVKGAVEMALDGYRELFEDWLPFYRSVSADKHQDVFFARQATLLRIMSTLDDTCVIHRVGFDRAQEVKAEARGLLQNFSLERLKEMCDRYAAEGISPGGAADMLALTIFMESILH